MLKNAYLLGCPAASPSWRRGGKSLLIHRDATLILPSVGCHICPPSEALAQAGAFLSILRRTTYFRICVAIVLEHLIGCTRCRKTKT
jgi:hypothetical protein